MASDAYSSELDSLLSESVTSVRERESTSFDRQLNAFNDQVVLFGAGNLGRASLRCLRTIGIEPLAFADNNSFQWGKIVEGVKVVPPKDAAKKWGASALFVVTIWSLNHRFSETKTALNSMGASNVIPASSLRWKFSSVLMPYFCQDMPHKVFQDSARVLEAASLWCDSKSKEEYRKQIQWRTSGDFDILTPPDAEESYFPTSIFDLKDEEFFVDGGSYTGDTLQRLLSLNGNKFSGIVAIEPDPENLSKLNQWIAKLDPSVSGRIRVSSVALGQERGRVTFAADGSEGSVISDSGNIVVDCLPLDELLDGTEPTYIKMDIEGAEPSAIMGAREVIRQHRPVLSICVYHTQDHVWSIPLLIHQIAPDYRLFLRPHEPDGWQLVCYAVPEARCKIK